MEIVLKTGKLYLKTGLVFSSRKKKFLVNCLRLDFFSFFFFSFNNKFFESYSK